VTIDSSLAQSATESIEQGVPFPFDSQPRMMARQMISSLTQWQTAKAT
jgi:hypothetical protein